MSRADGLIIFVQVNSLSVIQTVDLDDLLTVSDHMHPSSFCQDFLLGSIQMREQNSKAGYKPQDRWRQNESNYCECAVMTFLPHFTEFEWMISN